MKIEKIVHKESARVEDRCLCYLDSREIEHTIPLTKEQFALFELGFKDGHAEGIKFALNKLEDATYPTTIKQLEKIYG